MSDFLPIDVRDAADQGVVAALRAIKETEERDPTRGLLALWYLAQSTKEAEYARTLAIRAGSTSSSPALACRLWLMEVWATDIGVANTLLGILEADAAVRQQWTPVLGGALFGFLRSCLQHPEPSVKAGVLSVLALAQHFEIVAKTFPAVQGVALADDLERALRGVVDEDELDDLRDVVHALRGPSLVKSLPLAPRDLTRVALDLIDWAEGLGVLPDIHGLISCVRRRAMLDDAGLRAVRAMRPIQTIRVLAETASTRVFQAIVAFGEAVASVERQPDFGEMSAPDYGTEIAWAPGASVPIHLFFVNDDARRAFAVVEKLVEAKGRPVELDALIDGLDPVVAEALLKLIERLKQHEGRLEIVLTDPAHADWQRTVNVGPNVLGRQTVSRLSERTRAVAYRRGVVVHRDHVPQANTVRQVFQAVDAMLARGVVTLSDLSGVNSDRQVYYYKQGARILGFFDDDNRPTGRARAIATLSHHQRLGITAVFFEDTPIGRAWREWAGKDRLTDVDPDTAEEFLEACVMNLTGTTPHRRASTLRTWFQELMPHYPDDSV